MLPEPAPQQTRRFLPATFNAENPDDVERILEELLQEQPHNYTSARKWYATFNEASLAIGECHVRLEVKTQLDFENSDAEKRLRAFDEKILSKLLQMRGRLMQIYLHSPWRHAMHADDHDLIVRDFTARTRFSIPELAPLQIAENETVRRYRRFMSQATATYGGRRVPLSSVVGRMNDPSEETRKNAFFSYWKAISDNETPLQDLFTELLQNRHEQARVAQASGYVEVAFADLSRIDYSAADCEMFSRAIESTIVPLCVELSERQIRDLSATSIDPWNVSSWPALTPRGDPASGDLKQLLDSTNRIVASIHPELGELFATLRKRGLIDIEPHPRKAPGAFCVALQESGLPYIFGNFGGTTKDAFTLLHEFGHAAHAVATAHIENLLVRTPAMEFCEVASTTLEVLALDFLNEWWPNPKDRLAAKRQHLFNLLNFWPFMAMMDSWQHRIYAVHEMANAKTRNATWKELSRRFRPQVDWSPCPEFEELGWFSRPHLFTAPFYYVDYGIAQLGALQVWRKSKASFTEATAAFLGGLALGGQRPLPELFEAIGVRFDLSETQLSLLADELRCEILGPS
jgi:oligoendopeptidase F